MWLERLRNGFVRFCHINNSLDSDHPTRISELSGLKYLYNRCSVSISIETMLILILTFFLHVHAAPTHTPTENLGFTSNDVRDLISRTNHVSDGGRTMLDILWSCLVTIFACTWLAIHPNIPDPDLSWWAATGARFEITFYALMAPEVIIMWAMRQRVMASRIASQYKGMFLFHLSLFQV